MKTLTYTTAIVMAMAATSVFAHHPSLDTNPNYDMVTDQLEVVESPHLDMDVYDMGATEAAGDDALAEINPTQSGFRPEQTQDGTMTMDEPPQEGDGPGMDAAAAAGTMELMEDVGQ
jgi:hypothetical protein